MKENCEPLVSVVTPVYNGEKYISECIESVLAQTHKNWEYVIVNNCSTDRTGEIVRQYLKKDKRVRVHHNERFLPIIDNWNHAMEQISPESKYCKVVHADDGIVPECIEKMVSLAERYPTVGIVGGYRLDGRKVKSDGLPYEKNVFNGRDICRLTFRKELMVFGTPSSTLLRAELVRRDIRFYDADFFHADTEVCYRLLRDNGFGFVHQVLSFTRLHEESQSVTVAEKFDSGAPEFIGVLKKHGLVYFNRKEYEELLKIRLREYYRLMGKRFIQRRKKDYFDFHRKSMRKFGERFMWRKVVVGALYVLGRGMLNLEESFEKVKRKIGKGNHLREYI